MLRAYTAAAVRAAEQPLLDAGHGPALMRLAAHGLAEGVVSVLRSRGRRVYGARLVLLIGSGNNGGDALFAGAALVGRGARATALLTGARTHADALDAFTKAGGRIIEVAGAAARGVPPAIGTVFDEARNADVVLDGLLGTGGRGGLREPVAGIVARLGAITGDGDGPAVVACDLPSGVDATTGEVHGPVLAADLTVTFGAAKTGLVVAPGEQLCGTVRVVDIGIRPRLGAPDVLRLEEEDLAALLPRPTASEHKYTRGVVGIVAGSTQYPGAAQLAVAGAIACGVGMVRYLGPAVVAALIHQRSPEAVCSQGDVVRNKVQAWAVGSGIEGGADPDGQVQRSRDALASGLPVVADAGALLVLSGQVGPQVMLTPHAGELAALLTRLGHSVDRAAIEAHRLDHVRLAAKLTGATVLLKGATTLVAAPTGAVFSQSNGTAWLATAGSGDTLSGIIGALAAALAGRKGHFEALHVAAGESWAAVGAMGAALHGLAGVQAGRGGPLAATGISSAVPEVWRSLCDGGN